MLPDREIYINKPDYKVPNNKINTAKYTLLNFLPKNLFIQFSKAANLYFLVR